jgi:hypothetical protein
MKKKIVKKEEIKEPIKNPKCDNIECKIEAISNNEVKIL